MQTYFVILKTAWGVTSVAYSMKQMENPEEANSAGFLSLNSETMKCTQKHSGEFVSADVPESGKKQC